MLNSRLVDYLAIEVEETLLDVAEIYFKESIAF